jgi:hypothetical protein
MPSVTPVFGRMELQLRSALETRVQVLKGTLCRDPLSFPLDQLAVAPFGLLQSSLLDASVLVPDWTGVR